MCMKKWGEPSTPPDAGWATLVHLHQDPDPSVSAPDPRDPDGPPVSYPGIDSYFMNPNQGYLTAAGPVQTKLLIAIKNKMVLQGKNWAVTYGSATIPADAPAVTPDPKAAQGAAPAAPTPSPVRLAAHTDGADLKGAPTP